MAPAIFEAGSQLEFNPVFWSFYMSVSERGLCPVSIALAGHTAASRVLLLHRHHVDPK